MKIFITGATGFLGKALVNDLLKNNHKVTILILPTDTYIPPKNKNLTTIQGDITKPKTLSGVTKNHNAIIHLAGAVGYGQNWKTCFLLNKDGTKNIALEAIQSKVRRFILMSSVSVYGRVSNQPISEDFPLKKIGDPYGDTKIDSENIIQDFSSKNLLDTTIIRPTVIYGPGDDKFLPKLISNIQTKKAKIIGDGLNKVDLIHINDVLDFLKIVLQSKKAIGEIYNLTNPDNGNWKELLTITSHLLNCPVPNKKVPYPLAYTLAGILETAGKLTNKEPLLSRYAVRVVGKNYNYITKKAEKELGFKTKIELKKGLSECINHLRIKNHENIHSN